MERSDIADVADDAPAIAIGFKEAEAGGIAIGRWTKLGGVHELRRLRRKNAVLAHSAELDMRDQEARHVRNGCRKRASRNRLHECKRLGCGVRQRTIALCQLTEHCAGNWLAKGAATHVQRCQNMLLDIALERL